MSDNVQLRDANGNLVTFRTTDGGSYQTPHQIIHSYNKKLRSNFVDPTLPDWDITDPGGMSAVASAGVLTIATGTGAGDYLEMLSKLTFDIPFRATFGVSVSARNANTHFMVELVSVDPVTGLANDDSLAGWDIGGAISATATYAEYRVTGGGQRPLTLSPAIILTTAAPMILELEQYIDETYFHCRAIDAITTRANSYARQSVVPDPSQVYKLRIRALNAGAFINVTNAISGTGGVIRLTAAAHGCATGNNVWVEHMAGTTNGGAMVRGSYTVTVVDANTLELQGTVFGGAYVQGTGRLARGIAPAATNFVLQFAQCQDYNEITAEITGGRGTTAAGQGIAAFVTGGALSSTGVATALDNLYYNDSVTPQAASATLTGTARDVGYVQASASRYTKFNAFALADQAGTLRIEVSNDNVTWRRATVDTAVAANVPAFLQVPVCTRYHRVVYVNGGTIQTLFMLNSSYSPA
jgi:hypothetical protein